MYVSNFKHGLYNDRFLRLLLHLIDVRKKNPKSIRVSQFCFCFRKLHAFGICTLHNIEKNSSIFLV